MLGAGSVYTSSLERSAQNAGAPQVYPQLNTIYIPNATGSSSLIALASRIPALLLRPPLLHSYINTRSRHLSSIVKGMELTKVFTSVCLSSAQHSLSAYPVFAF